ncbi:MAG: hypothetical protein Fur0021_05130 [Candidatus Promineifilaceae bacterium]
MCVEHDKLVALIPTIIGDEGDGAEEIIGRVTHIVCQNVKRGRFKIFLDAGKDRDLEGYVRYVVGNYRRQRAKVEGLQFERDADLWPVFYRDVEDWVYDYLISRGFVPNEGTFRLVQDYRSFAVEQVLLAHFPYDIPFERWARTVVQHVCRKQIDRAMCYKRLCDKQMVGLEQWQSNAVYRSHEDDLIAVILSDELLVALQKLPTNYRIVIQLYYFNDMEYQEIAEVMQKTIRAVYNLHYKAMKRLREILTTKGYNSYHGIKQPIQRHSRQAGISAHPTDPGGKA